MDSLIDNLVADKWVETSSDSRGDGFQSYSINRNHKHTDPATMIVMIATEDGDPKSVCITGTKDNKDPLKNIGHCDLKLDEDEKNVIGIDLDGDCVVCK